MALILFSVVVNAVRAQSSTLPPDQHGQWAGPFLLGGDAPNTAITNAKWAEITHIAVIPPHRNAVNHSFVGHLLLWCRRHFCVTTPSCNCSTTVCPPPGVASLYRLNPRRPDSVRRYDIAGTDPAVDPFCSGHTWLWDGDLLIAGGNNFSVPFSTTTGHENLYRVSFGTLTPALEPTITTSIGTGAPLSPMHSIRWYPGVIALPNRTAAVLGHYGANGIPAPDPLQEFQREIFDTTMTPPATVDLIHESRDILTASCAATPALPRAFVGDYPRIFQLRNGLAFHAGPTAKAENTTPAFWDTTGLLQGATFSGITQPTCSAPVDRWITDTVSSEPDPSPSHLDGGAIHLITITKPGQPSYDGVWTETIYQFGGNEHYETGDCCGCGAHDDGTREVERLYNPNPSSILPFGPESDTAHWDRTPHDLNVTRTDLAPVVLLDGSIMVFGGEGHAVEGCGSAPLPPCGSCVARMKPERLKPVEVFGGTERDWEFAAPHSQEHRYHCVAAMLDDGRVVIGGGQSNAPPPLVSDKSVEIYSPTYMFRGSRPIIDPVSYAQALGPSLAALPGQPLQFDVAVASASESVSRVALLRPASMTHSVDFNQRYVECSILFQSPTSADGVIYLQVVLPPDRFYIPAGWYMLTVVDSQGRPSEAQWIRIRENSQSP